MNRKRIAQYCCAALVAAGIGLNIQNATVNYGINANRLALMAVGGSNSASGTILPSIGPMISVVSWIVSVFTDDSTTPTPEPDPEPKSLKCEIEEQTAVTTTNQQDEVHGEGHAGNNYVGGSGGGSHQSGSTTATTSHPKRWACQASEDGDMTPSECQPKCLSKNPK